MFNAFVVGKDKVVEEEVEMVRKKWDQVGLEPVEKWLGGGDGGVVAGAAGGDAVGGGWEGEVGSTGVDGDVSGGGELVIAGGEGVAGGGGVTVASSD
ncbi:hypothetical protein L1987_43352 [Smallanthus sonchifolius]|uniref:Uncharacterized protein n=1 Tax=Smallanthus sonchifolius TaxID=185202 RepID=A0ACB9GNF0_9ASTR|nr:hypothetical protein L1987_43352 [Smallanthus sonchifolius]